MTCEHQKPLLESERDSGLLCQVANLLARGEIPPTALQALGLGRFTALKKEDDGVRGIVVSDVVRRLVARTMAKQCALSAGEATAPFQCALRTRAGCECVSHVLQTITDQTPTRQLCRLMGSGRSILSSATQCCKGCWAWKAVTGCFHLSGFSMGTRPHSSGRTIWEAFTTSVRVRGANKGTPWCPCCSVWDSMRR